MGLNGRQFFSVQKGVSQERLADLLVDAAHASLRMTQPYIFAVLVYDHDKELALKTAESIIASSSFGSRDILAARRLKEVALTALGRWDEAITEYKAAIALDPKDAHPHNGLGMVLPALGRWDEAAHRIQGSDRARSERCPPAQWPGHGAACSGPPG
jgi:tetratricopeptide (TPR) repeat protein